MKFGGTFTEYLRGDGEGFLGDCSHVEYRSVKQVLKGRRSCRESVAGSDSHTAHPEEDSCLFDSCPICDWLFFAELMKEASYVSGCYST